MKILTTLMFLVFISSPCFSQNYLEEVNGRPIRGGKLSDVVGDPHLFKNFKSATVLLKNGTSVKNIPVNVDLVTNTPLFSKSGNVVLAFVDPVAEMLVVDTLSSGVTKMRYTFDEDGKETSCFLVLSDGKLGLVKKLWKVVWEDKTYNSATVTKTILGKSAYYLKDTQSNSLNLFKPSKKNILAAMSSQSAAVEKYLKDSKVSFSSDHDLQKLFDYYNAL
jgi:dsDNA-binding SOS-regulon protein